MLVQMPVVMTANNAIKNQQKATENASKISAPMPTNVTRNDCKMPVKYYQNDT